VALDHGHAFDETVNVRQRCLQRPLRLLHAAGNRGCDVAHLAGGRRDPAIARHRLRRGVAQ
jgi:hypothetical protein